MILTFPDLEEVDGNLGHKVFALVDVLKAEGVMTDELRSKL